MDIARRRQKKEGKREWDGYSKVQQREKMYEEARNEVRKHYKKDNN